MTFEGKRYPDTVFGELPSEGGVPPAGAYWKVMSRRDPSVPLKPEDLGHKGNPGLTDTVWGIVTPNGLYGMLSIHTVREEDDGTISIRPGDGSSNSVLIQGATKSWHGYIEHGVWSEV